MSGSWEVGWLMVCWRCRTGPAQTRGLLRGLSAALPVPGLVLPPLPRAKNKPVRCSWVSQVRAWAPWECRTTWLIGTVGNHRRS